MLTDLERADVYDAAADYMEDHGWTTGKLQDEDTGAVCVSGAIGAVINPSLISWRTGTEHTEDERMDWLVATAKLAEFVEPFDDIVRGYSFGLTKSPVAWNNRKAADKFEVIELLRRAAKELRNAG